MKIVIIVDAVGMPCTLASTCHVGTLTEAFSAAGAPTRVVGVAKDPALWLPDALGRCDATAPLLSARSPRLRDEFQAAWFGIIRHTESDADDSTEWYDELLLLRDLRRFASRETEGVIMVYPRFYSVLKMAHRLAAFLGWKTMIFGTEGLTDNLIDPNTRDDYVRHVREKCDGIWAVSSDIAEFWSRNGVPPERIFISHTAVRRGFFEAVSSPARSSEAVYLGNLVREMDYLIEIAEMVAEDVPDFHITIYGDAPPADRAAMIQQIASRGLSESMTVEAAVPPVEVPGVLRNADVLLVPRALKGPFPPEGFPQKLGEYLASGRPTVVTAVRDIPKYLKDDVNAFVVPPDDTKAFAEAVVKVLRNPENAEKVGAKGREVAARLFSADGIAEQALSFMRDLTPRRKEWPR